MILTEKDINELLYEGGQSFLPRIDLIAVLCKLEPDTIISEYKERCKELETAKLEGVSRNIILQSIKNKVCDDHYAALLLKGWNHFQIHEALGLP
jgi:hypothetical protein